MADHECCLSDQERQELESLLATTLDEKTRKRAMTIYLLCTGLKPAAIATQLGVSLSSIYRWRQSCVEDGISMLMDKPRSGRPPKADEAYMDHLEHALQRHPETFGYAFKSWTTVRLNKHMRKLTNTVMSNDHLRQLIRELGYESVSIGELWQSADVPAEIRGRLVMDALDKTSLSNISKHMIWIKKR